MTKLIVGNWKMNPSSQEEAIDLAQKVELGVKDIANLSVVIVPPFLFLSPVATKIKRIKLGAQDVFAGDSSRSHTGEISVEELKNAGVEYVIVGHSERRKQGETNEEAISKAKVVYDAGLTPILCVGEPKDIRNRGLNFAKEFIQDQLLGELRGLEDNLIIAYEPIWAISSNKEAETAEVEDVIEIVSFIKNLFKVKVLYGGSVDSSNSTDFLSEETIDGVLVGRASLNSEEFIKIIKS